MPAATEPLPRWDMSNVYSSLQGKDYQAAFQNLESLLADLEAFFDQHQVGRGHPTEKLVATPDWGPTLEQALKKFDEIARLTDTIEAFVYAYFTTDSFDQVAAREMSKLELLGTRRQKLSVRLQGWLGKISDTLPNLLAERPALQPYRFFLTFTAEQSKFLMSEELEALSADLSINAGGAFGKLQGNVTSQLQVPFERDGRTELTPITVIRNLSYDPDRDVRQRAYQAEIAGWDSIRTSVAAALNSVKGTALTLSRWRGRKHLLDVAIEQNRIDRATLDALLGAIRESFPIFRRYLQAKAKHIGLPRLAWWDLFAPLGAEGHTFTWSEARAFIIEKFATFSPELSAFAERAFDQRWIDAEPRNGKRGGAYCMGVMGIEESRILANFDGSFEQVSTLAHELGHAYHNECQHGLAPLRRGSPMSLAETASIFCETLIAEAALENADRATQLAILELQLGGATQVCLDISSRFLFEMAFCERRLSSELSPEEISALMLDAQRETYGDAIDPATYHQYMWLWKPHYYCHGENFYNFPYAFGHLFALGLYAEFKKQGPAFVPRYVELLRDTGENYAAPLAARFGMDITQPDFWRGSLSVIEGQLQRFETE